MSEVGSMVGRQDVMEECAGNEPDLRVIAGKKIELGLKLVQELEGHMDRVWSVSWSSANGLLASCSGDKTVRIWGHSSSSSPYAPTWACKAVLDETHTRTVRSCAWSPNGRLLATASFDGTTGIWENIGGDFDCVATLEGHENEVKSVAWNSSGMLLATCSRDKHLWIWEALPGNEFECMSVLAGHTQDVKMVAWHPFRDILVSVSYDNSIKIWIEDGEGDDWRCIQTLAEPGMGHTSTVWAASFEASGDRMVSCSDDLSLMVWDTSQSLSTSSGAESSTWKHLYTISGYHDRTIFSVHWSRVNNLIASGAADDCIRVFAQEKSETLQESNGNCSSFSMVGRKTAAHSTDVNCVQWHPQESRLLASTGDDGSVKIWELEGTLDSYTNFCDKANVMSSCQGSSW